MTGIDARSHHAPGTRFTLIIPTEVDLPAAYRYAGTIIAHVATIDSPAAVEEIYAVTYDGPRTPELPSTDWWATTAGPPLLSDQWMATELQPLPAEHRPTDLPAVNVDDTPMPRRTLTLVTNPPDSDPNSTSPPAP